MSVTYQNEDGRTLTVEVGDTVTVRSFATSFGVPHLVTEVAPRADSAISAVNRNGDYVDLRADRVIGVTAGNVRPELVQPLAPLTGAAPGTVLNEAAYDRETGMLRASARRPGDAVTRGASAPNAAGTGNS